MNIIITDIKDLIVASTDLVWGQTLVGGREPSSPRDVVTLFESPGGGPSLQMEPPADGDTNEQRNEKSRYDYATIQVRIRNIAYDKAMERGWEILNILHNRGNEVINGTVYTLIQALDNPSLLDWDDNNRARIIINFEIQRTPQPVA